MIIRSTIGPQRKSTRSELRSLPCFHFSVPPFFTPAGGLSPSLMTLAHLHPPTPPGSSSAASSSPPAPSTSSPTTPSTPLSASPLPPLCRSPRWPRPNRRGRATVYFSLSFFRPSGVGRTAFFTVVSTLIRLRGVGPCAPASGNDSLTQQRPANRVVQVEGRGHSALQAVT